MASGGGVLEESLREATTRRECSCAACQKPAQSHAATPPPSSGSKRHASRSQKAQTSSSSHANTTFTEQIYIRGCCFDLSNAPRLSGVKRVAGSHFQTVRGSDSA